MLLVKLDEMDTGKKHIKENSVRFLDSFVKTVRNYYLESPESPIFLIKYVYVFTKRKLWYSFRNKFIVCVTIVVGHFVPINVISSHYASEIWESFWVFLIKKININILERFLGIIFKCVQFCVFTFCMRLIYNYNVFLLTVIII